MDMRLERATQFSNRSQLIRRQARLFSAAIKGGPRRPAMIITMPVMIASV